ncbi:MAG: SAM-dependent methyltransferase [Psychromonas sp.]|jgi:SAM-dependent methyltransferase
MNRIIKLTKFVLAYLGFYPDQLFQNLKEMPSFFTDLSRFKKALNGKYSDWSFKYYPILTDKKDQSGKARGQYFYQDLFVANLIYKSNPNRHIDIGSRIDGFIAHLASFREVDVMDIRPLNSIIQNISFIQADLMRPAPQLKESTDSLSCLHTIEHFGLGRYGDKLDIDGHLKGLDSMYQILKKGGLFYFSTQIGPSTIAFNAHRVFSVSYLLSIFEEHYELLSFSYIDDNDVLHQKVDLTKEGVSKNFNCKLGCGIFELKKL